MPDIDQNQDQAQEQDPNAESYQLTGDDLSELHTVARHLQAGGDPRAQKLWDVVAAQSGGGDGSGGPEFRVTQSPPVTSWVEDLENTLWGGSRSGPGSTQGVQDAESAANADVAGTEDDSSDGASSATDEAGDVSGETAEDGQQQLQSQISTQGASGQQPNSQQQSGDALTREYLAGPSSQLAGYLKWRNQNFRPATGAGWEAPSGRLYTDQDLNTMYAAQRPQAVPKPIVPAQPQQQQQSKQRSLVDVALGQVDSTDYEFDKSKGAFKAGVDKCNLGVADWIEQSGRPRPQVRYTDPRGWLGLTRDPSTHEWADPNVQIPGWSAPMPVSKAQPGDVIAQAHGDRWGHAGIVVAKGQTISVNSTTHPAGIVTNTDWGFRPRLPYGPNGLGQNGESARDPEVVVRRYIGDKK